MKITALCVALAALSSGCISVNTFTPGGSADKGVWISKGKGIGPLQLSDPEILYCQPGASPNCTVAKQNSALAGTKVQ